MFLWWSIIFHGESDDNAKKSGLEPQQAEIFLDESSTKCYKNQTSQQQEANKNNNQNQKHLFCTNRL